MFLHTGLQNFVKLDEIEAMNSNVYSAPTRRLVKSAEADGRLIDHTEGRKTRSVIFLRSGAVVLSCVESATLVKRGNAMLAGEAYEDVDPAEDEAGEPEPAPAPTPPVTTAASNKGGKGGKGGKGNKGGKAQTAAAAPPENTGGDGGILEDLPE